MEEREAELTTRYENIATLEEDIERERKSLIALTASYRELGSGVADVVVQNQKVRDLMERRKGMAYPESWIEEIGGVSRKDVFESKRDQRKLPGGVFYQIKRRVEPISSLYVNVGVTDPEVEETAVPLVPSAAVTAAAAPKTAEQIAQDTKRGAIVQQTKKKSFKVSGI
jgi:hypothetical protein